MTTPTDHPFSTKGSSFVIKLRLSGNGGASQIRRVLLNRLLDEHDNVSYTKLVDVAIGYAFPEKETIIPADYEIVLTYYDVDNDCVTIASTEELMDAVQQYHAQEKPVLRITTEVKCTNPSTPLPLPDMDNRDAANESAVGSPALSPDGSPTSIKKLVETFVSMLAAAVAAMQLKMMYGERPTGDYSKEVAAAALANMDAEQAKELNETAEKLVREVVGNIGLEENRKAETGGATAGNGQTEAPPEATQARCCGGPGAEEGEEAPFIHGRHTCDGCLTTPIVGVRYHSTNLPDYDLCAKCRFNYKGDEIQFEAVELDRDRPFQERWQKKRARWTARRGNGEGGGRGRRGGMRGGMRGAGPHCGHGPRWHRRRNPGWGGQPQPPAAPQGPEDALQEAIRRSLEDVQPTAEVPVEATVAVQPQRSEPEVFATVAVTATAAQSVAGTEAVTDIESDTEDKPLITAEVEVAPAQKAPAEIEIEMKATKIEPQPGHEAARVVVDDETPGDKKIPPVAVDSDRRGHEPRLVEEEIVVPPAIGEVLETPTKRAATVPKASPTVTEFSDDADGNGSVAKAIGQTLDKCANAIDEMMDEIKRDVFTDALSVESDIRTELNRAVAAAAVPPAIESTVEEASVEASEDTRIVDGDDEEEEEEEEEEKSQKSEDGWHVVSSQAQTQTSTDEALARAAQMIGSALFESDMRSSQMSNSIASVPSSVPTVSTDVAPVQLDRWSIQLGQLKELGFDDEAKCVEILERLNAANIGVGEEEEITVTQVVNELLN